MAKEFYSKEEELLISGVMALERRKLTDQIYLLLDYEMGKLMEQMEKSVDQMEKEAGANE